MEKQTKIFTQLSTGALVGMVAVMYVCFSSCEKKVIPVIPKFYNVTFDTQGGSEINPITEVKEGDVITLPPSPRKAGSTFDGWHTDKECVNSFSETTTINSNIILYAKWVEHLYTVTFDTQGGSTVNPITELKYGSFITMPPNPTKENYTFAGWFPDKVGTISQFSPTTPITADLILYARWFFD